MIRTEIQLFVERFKETEDQSLNIVPEHLPYSHSSNFLSISKTTVGMPIYQKNILVVVY
jgi:hypothetical protein